MASEKDVTKMVDTPMQNSAVNTPPPEPATPPSEPCKPLPDHPQIKDFAAKDTSRPSTNSSHFKPSTPIRDYIPHPRLWVDDGPEAGKAIAKWRANFVPVLEQDTKGMTDEERTKYFDKMVRQDEDRYCQAIATYYTVHPEHIPDRELDPKTLKRQDAGWVESPKIDMAQQKCFGNWMANEAKWGPKSTEAAPEVGPKNETTPDEQPPECEHCVKEAKKSQSLIRKAVRKISMSKDHKATKHTRRATECTKDKPTNLAFSMAEREAEYHLESKESKDYTSSSSDGKEREARTETGVGLAKPAPKKRMSIAQKFGLSTVRTR